MKEEILNTIENEMLDLISLYDEVTTSDLQGIARAKAIKIYNLISGVY